MTQTILRRWNALVRTDRADAYGAYIAKTGARDYGATAGCLGWQVLLRDRGDGTSEVTTLSWWRDMKAIEAFAGSDVDRARYYPEDADYLLTRPERVEHHRVAGGEPLLHG